MVSEFAFDLNKWKKALVLSLKLAPNTQLVFTCSNAGTETLGQVVKYVQSLLTHYSDLSIVDCEKVNAVWVGWIVEGNVFQSETQVTLKIGSYYHLLKLQKSSLPSTLAKMEITFLRITLVLSWFTSEFFLPQHVNKYYWWTKLTCNLQVLFMKNISNYSRNVLQYF